MRDLVNKKVKSLIIREKQINNKYKIYIKNKTWKITHY